MEYNQEELHIVFSKGRCYYCKRTLWYSHLNRRESPFGWFVENIYDRLTGKLDFNLSRASCFSCSRNRRGRAQDRDRRINRRSISYYR